MFRSSRNAINIKIPLSNPLNGAGQSAKTVNVSFVSRKVIRPDMVFEQWLIVAKKISKRLKIVYSGSLTTGREEHMILEGLPLAIESGGMSSRTIEPATTMLRSPILTLLPTITPDPIVT